MCIRDRVNELLKYHRMMQKMMKSLTSGRGRVPIPIPKMQGMPMKMMKKLK